MGMDVSGLKPTSERGHYFRASVWQWRPLWAYITALYPPAKKVSGMTNDGEGLRAPAARELARRMEHAIEMGAAANYVATRDRFLAKLPDEPCEICEGTGKRLPPPAVGAGDQPCNGCKEAGTVRPSQTWYVLDLDTIRDFAAFCRDSGGFRID